MMVSTVGGDGGGSAVLSSAVETSRESSSSMSPPAGSSILVAIVLPVLPVTSPPPPRERNVSIEAVTFVSSISQIFFNRARFFSILASNCFRIASFLFFLSSFISSAAICPCSILSLTIHATGLISIVSINRLFRIRIRCSTLARICACRFSRSSFSCSTFPAASTSKPSTLLINFSNECFCSSSSFSLETLIGIS